MVTECCLYKLFLQRSFHRATGLYWEALAPSCWMCDGIIEGDAARDISNTLHEKIHWEIVSWMLDGVFKNLMGDPKAPFYLVKDNTPLLKRLPHVRSQSHLRKSQSYTKQIISITLCFIQALQKSWLRH